MRNQQKAILFLEDGLFFKGKSLGSLGETSGEVCFNTGMTGYQEILTDPSYAKQMIVMCSPHIGNYGTNESDVESSNIYASGFIIKNESLSPSNWRSTSSLEEFLKSNVSELLVCELHKPIQYSSLRRIILSFKNVAEEKDSTLPIILLVSSFENKVTGVESRWYMKPSLQIASSTKERRFFLEERWELVCSKSRLSVSSWIIKARQQGYDRRTIKVCKTIA